MGMGPIRSSDGDDGFGGAPLAEINVTPLVDVMLVLLIIFMVAAPLLTVGVPVQLPKTAAQKVAEPRTPLIVTIDRDGRVFMEKEELTPETVGARFAAMAAEKGADQVVLVRGDRAIDYGRVLEVMGQVSQAGFSKVSLIANAPHGVAGP